MRKPQDRLYKIYNSLKYRVRHKNETMDELWFNSFDLFKEWSMSNGYNESFKMFRKIISDGYFPNNCVWGEKSTVARKANGRKKAFCTCGSQVARAGSKCVKCNGLSKRKDINIDRKTYARDWSLKKKYGISLNDFNIILEKQNGKCTICNKLMEEPSSTRGQGLDVMALDHCHETGKIRSILCNACNKGLGMFNDDISLLENALKYIKEHNVKKIS